MNLRREELVAAAEEQKRRRLVEAEGEIEAQFQRDVEAIDRVLALNAQAAETNGNGHPPLSLPEQTRSFGIQTWPGLSLAIRRAIDAHQSEFDLDSILNWIVSQYPDKELKRVDLSRELWRLKQKRRIQVVEPGAGKRPAIYMKVEKTTEKQRDKF
ncbi:MAG TPA: hypothetical protein VGR35_01060 [Tepidisphaeraceae bacterium]|nr:hypothetical protein [Tepidisphaeraceae bacterium]